MSNITDEQVFGQELDRDDGSAAVAENFCPFEQTVCLCWDMGGMSGGKLHFKND